MINSPTNEIYFFHIPKTAGTSLAELIRSAYPKAECIPAHTVLELVALPPRQVPYYRCYTGHFFSLLRPLVGRDVPTVTLLREPFEQTMSLIRHCQRIDRVGGVRAPLFARGLEKAWKFLPNLRTRIETRWCPVVMNNFQTRVLGAEIEHPGRLRPDYYGITYPFLHQGFSSPTADLEQLFERAKTRLDQMAVVGTVERMNESVELIFDCIGAPKPETIPHLNVGRKQGISKSYRHSGQVSPEFAALIERENVYDKALYQYAETLLERSIRRRAPVSVTLQ